MRDLIHVDDVVELIDLQLGEPERWRGVVANVGGGRECSLSLLELTALCREITGKTFPLAPQTRAPPGTSALRLRLLPSLRLTDWRPRSGATAILADTYDWIVANESALGEALESTEEAGWQRQS